MINCIYCAPLHNERNRFVKVDFFRWLACDYNLSYQNVKKLSRKREDVVFHLGLDEIETANKHIEGERIVILRMFVIF